MCDEHKTTEEVEAANHHPDQPLVEERKDTITHTPDGFTIKYDPPITRY
jgi:hypothetical protein